jgi:hypothetical protein
LIVTIHYSISWIILNGAEVIVPHTSESLQAAFSYLFISEVEALKELARSLPPNPIVCNIGAGAGTSGLAFMESRPDLRLWTIDIRREDSPFGCLFAELRVISEAFPGMMLYNRYLQVEGDSKIVGEAWQVSDYIQIKQESLWGYNQSQVDLVFIDGDHSYNGAKGDILSWLPNIKPGGIMAVHDYGKKEVYKDGPIAGAPHPLPWPGVDRAVRKFLCPKYEIVKHVATLIAFRIE